MSSSTDLVVAAIQALAFLLAHQDRVRDVLVEQKLLVWMEEVASNLRDEVDIQMAIA